MPGRLSQTERRVTFPIRISCTLALTKAFQGRATWRCLFCLAVRLGSSAAQCKLFGRPLSRPPKPRIRIHHVGWPPSRPRATVPIPLWTAERLSVPTPGTGAAGPTCATCWSTSIASSCPCGGGPTPGAAAGGPQARPPEDASAPATSCPAPPGARVVDSRAAPGAGTAAADPSAASWSTIIARMGYWSAMWA